MKIVIAGGGTAGHVLPALAVANEIRNRFNHAELVFIGSKGGADEKLIPVENYQIKYLPKADFPRKINLSALAFIPRFSTALIKSLLLLRGANIAIGFGGYVATPMYVAARILNIPIAIHEANAVPGLANRVGRRWAKVIAVFNPVSSWKNQHVIGFPMRKSITDSAKLNGKELLLAKEAARKELGLTLEGTGKSTLVKTIDSENYLQIPYLAKMESAYLAADFVVARGGAGTCAEIEAMGLPAIFIPLSIGNGEQVANAERYAARGSAKILLNSNLTSGNLLSIILEVNNAFVEFSKVAATNKGNKLSAASDFVDLIDEEIFHSSKGRI